MSTLKVDALQDTSGNGFYPARAWVRFNAQSTLTINESRNVSSMTDYGTGYYGVFIDNDMPDANYVISGMSKDGDSVGAAYEGYFHLTVVLAGQFTLYNTAQGTADDTDIGCLLVTR